ncbi:MAG TPA: hypothetical protein VGI47_09215, partial [Candidatus Binataceae bacterium]
LTGRTTASRVEFFGEHPIARQAVAKAIGNPADLSRERLGPLLPSEHRVLGRIPKLGRPGFLGLMRA